MSSPSEFEILQANCNAAKCKHDPVTCIKHTVCLNGLCPSCNPEKNAQLSPPVYRARSPPRVFKWHAAETAKPCK